MPFATIDRKSRNSGEQIYIIFKRAILGGALLLIRKNSSIIPISRRYSAFQFTRSGLNLLVLSGLGRGDLAPLPSIIAKLCGPQAPVHRRLGNPHSLTAPEMRAPGSGELDRSNILASSARRSDAMGLVQSRRGRERQREHLENNGSGASCGLGICCPAFHWPEEPVIGGARRLCASGKNRTPGRSRGNSLIY